MQRSRIVIALIIGVLLIGGFLLISGFGADLYGTPDDNGDDSETAVVAATQTPLPTITALPATSAPFTDAAAISPTAPVMRATATQAIISEPARTATAAPTFSGEVPMAVGGESPALYEVAALPLVVRDASGQQIGDGTVRYYAPQQVSYPDTALIELEIELDNLYVETLPNRTPVPRMTATPRPGQPTPTERIPLYQESGLIVSQRMGASLFCPVGRFTGCDASADPADAKIIDPEAGAAWSWIIAPNAGINGLQDLRLEIWTLQIVNDGPETARTVWMDSFQIEVNPARSADQDESGGASWLGILIGMVALSVLLVGAVYAWRRWQPASQKPTIFLSYQRKSGWAAARTLHDRLLAMGAEVFIDVDDINEGRFAEIIENAIRASDYFIVVLAPGTLESEWVRREIQTAFNNNKNIIPVLVSGFLLDDNLPPDVRDLSTHNAITITPEYYEAAIEKLARFVGLVEPET